VPGTGAIYSDPLFAMNYINDFHLTASSPCISTGLDNYDIGALPYTVRPVHGSARGPQRHCGHSGGRHR